MNPFVVDRMVLKVEPIGHHAVSECRMFQVLFIHNPHQRKVLRAFTCRLKIVRAARNAQQLTLTANAQLRMIAFDQATTHLIRMRKLFF